MLLNEWGGGDGRKETSKTSSSKKRELLKDRMEYSLEDTNKEIMGDGQLALTKDTNLDISHGKLRKRGVQAEKKKTREVKRGRQSGKPKPVANKKTNERKQKIRMIEKKQKKVQGTGRRNSSKKYLGKEIFQLELEVKKLKEQRKKLKKEIRRATQRKTPIKRKDIRTKCSRDAECSEKWAAFASVSLGLAPIVIKQVDNTLYIPTSHYLQANSILASDRTLVRKKSKKDDFLEHQSILQKALSGNPCDGGNAYGNPPSPPTPPPHRFV